jgi:hypothetical protein
MGVILRGGRVLKLEEGDEEEEMVVCDLDCRFNGDNDDVDLIVVVDKPLVRNSLVLTACLVVVNGVLIRCRELTSREGIRRKAIPKEPKEKNNNNPTQPQIFIHLSLSRYPLPKFVFFPPLSQ